VNSSVTIRNWYFFYTLPLLTEFLQDRFCHRGFKKSYLAFAIKSIRAETLKAINRLIVAHAQDKAVEKSRKVRIDCTVICPDIHDPSETSLLLDSVRVITQLPEQIKKKDTE